MVQQIEITLKQNDKMPIYEGQNGTEFKLA